MLTLFSLQHNLEDKDKDKDKDNWTMIIEEAFEDLGQLVSLLVIISVMGL